MSNLDEMTDAGLEKLRGEVARLKKANAELREELLHYRQGGRTDEDSGN